MLKNKEIKKVYLSSILVGLLIVFTGIEVFGQNAVCHNYHPNWSSKGDKLVFDGRRGESHEIFVYDFTTKKITQLTDAPGRDAHPFWSPNGEKIVFQSPRASGKMFIVDIYVMDADGSNVKRLTEKPGFSGVPSWSSDGEKIIFQFKPMDKQEDFRKNFWDLYTIKPDGTDEKRITNLNTEDQVPNWTRDSQSIIFHSDRTGNNELYIMKIDGSGLKQITFNPGNDSSALFSPDGKSIAFKSDRNGSKGKRDIYVMDNDGKNLRQLTDGYNVYGIPSWSPDGKRLAFHSGKSGNNELYVIDIKSKNIERITECK